MKKLAFDLSNLSIKEVLKFETASSFIQRPGDCVRMCDYSPIKNIIAVTVGYWSSGNNIFSLSLRHSHVFYRSPSFADVDIYIEVEDWMNQKGRNISIGSLYRIDRKCGDPSMKEIRQAWPKTLPPLSVVIRKIQTFLGTTRLNEIIEKVEQIELEDHVLT